MAKNIHAGHCPQGHGAHGAVGILKESVENRIVKNYLISLLKSKGETIYDCTDESNCNQRQNLYNIVAKCNSHAVDLDISIHLDAARNDYVGDGSTGGCTVLTTGNHAYVDAIAAKIVKEISEELGIRNRGVVHRNDLYVLNHTYSPALLIECCFVDDKDDADRWSASRCANAIYRGITGAAAASWVKDSIGWWYQNADGSYPRSCWKEIDGDWYYFNAKGYALASEWILYKNKWYYLKEDCRMAKGWAEVENEWYYLDQNGAMLDGWQFINDKWYYLDERGEEKPHGAMWTGAVTVDKHEYMLDDSGAMLKGWIQDGEEWFFYNKDLDCQPVGSMMRNHWVEEEYYLKDDGRMAKDETLTIGEKEYSFDADGKIVE